MGDTYIGNTYLFKDNATLEDINSLIETLSKLKREYSDFIKENIKEEMGDSAKSLMVFTGINGLADKIIKSSKAYEKGVEYDYSLDLAIYCHNNKIVVGAFGGSTGLGFFRERFDYPSYDYIGHVEDDDEVPEDWEERGNFWDDIFSKTGVPANVSLAYNIYDEDNVNSICWDLFNETIRNE